jgi:hypothetical protein
MYKLPDIEHTAVVFPKLVSNFCPKMGFFLWIDTKTLLYLNYG